jgi:hypothetical protein
MAVFEGRHAPSRAFLPAGYQIQRLRNPFHCPSLPLLFVLFPAPVAQMDMHMVMAVVEEPSVSARDWGAICPVLHIDWEAKAFSVGERAT